MSNEFDLVIVGGGIAAIALLEELSSTLDIRIAIVYGGAITERLEKSDTLSSNHHPLDECSNAVFGGTSKTWGGRCVDYNEVDFLSRDYIKAEWPINKHELAPYYPAACDFFEIGTSGFDYSGSDSLMDSHSAFSTSSCERWSLPLRLQGRRKEFESQTNITIIDDFHLLRLEKCEIGYRLISNDESGGMIETKLCVLAAGGLGTTKILLNSLTTEEYPALGKYYQGHLSGKIANIVFNNPENVDYSFQRDKGVYTRWRFQPTCKTVKNNKLLNSALWIDNLPVYDSSHGNAILSFVYLLFSMPLISKFLAPPSIRKALLGGVKFCFKKHLKNVIKSPLSVLSFVVPFFFKRYVLKRKIPGFFLFSPHGKYSLHFHSEQEPVEHNKIVKKKGAGFDIRYVFSDFDCESVLTTHKLLDEYLREEGLGYLEFYSNDHASLIETMRHKCIDGIHQIGLTRMSSSQSDGVVDQDLEVFNMENLFVLSSGVFPTSSQANPTFLLVVFAKRLSNEIKGRFS